MPLPKPKPSESRNEFVSRCIIDFNVRNDFNTVEQRVAVCNSLFTQEKEIKSAEDNFNNSFDKLLDSSELRQVRKFYKFYQDQYDKAIKMFISQGSLNSSDVQAFFKLNDIQFLYVSMYEEIGMTFAKWYAKNFKKFMPKQIDLDVQGTIWQQAFAFFGGQVAAKRVTSVSNTARKTLISVMSRLMRDPEFMRKGNDEKARILKSQFTNFSSYQSKRVVRTETTGAANYGTLRSAYDLFGANNLLKRWSTRLDGKEREAHRNANNQTVEFEKSFEVGGEKMAMPGTGSIASNNINCRCKAVPLPKANAQTIGEPITGIGFGLQGANVVSVISNAVISEALSSAIISQANKPKD